MKIHDSNEISLSLAAFPIDSGRGEIGGDFCKVTPKGPAFGFQQSIDGDGTRFRIYNQGADISIFLMSTSPANAFLSALFTADINVPGGAGVGAFSVIDRNSTGTLHFAEHCWITQMPEHALGEKPALLEWKLECASIKSFIAGN